MILDISLTTFGLAIAIPLCLFIINNIINNIINPAIDPSEPPLLKPRFPIIGHLIAMIREKNAFHSRLHTESRMPICTLPILNGRLYVINSPSLVQAALRSADISFEPFLIDFPRNMFGLSDRLVDIFRKRDVLDGLLTIIHSTLLGDSLHKMNIAALTSLIKPINDITTGRPLITDNTFTWLRDHLTYASTTALYGDKNPITMEQGHFLWDYDSGARTLALGKSAAFMVPTAKKARDELQQLCIPYYQAKHDQRPETSDIIRQRGERLRSEGFTDEDLGIEEIFLAWVAVTNTAPTMFWLFVRTFSNPEYIARVRNEAAAVTTVNGSVAVMETANLDKKMPFLYALYQETLRYYMHGIGNRRVIQDTHLEDSDGRSYLLKKGINVQYPSSVLHTLETTWGDEANRFDPHRWLSATAQDNQKRRGAFLPFGGGRHLCPGRRFAFTEIMGFMAILALGFEVEGVELPTPGISAIGHAPKPPVWKGENQGMKISRRKDFGDVTVNFE